MGVLVERVRGSLKGYYARYSALLHDTSWCGVAPMRVTPMGFEGGCSLGPPRISLDSPTPYQKAPPKLWPLLSDGSHRSYIIWWAIFLMARSRERRQLATNGAPQNAAVRCQNSCSQKFAQPRSHAKRCSYVLNIWVTFLIVHKNTGNTPRG